jgi:hypothetical protein
VTLTFREHLRIGVPITIATIAIGAMLLVK